MANQLFLNKQPILDGQQNLYGYQFSMETMGEGVVPADQWAKEVKSFCEGIQKNVGVENLTAGKPAFYKTPAQLLRLDLLPKIEPLSSLTVEVTSELLKDKESLTALKEIIQAGVKVAIDDYQPSEANDKLLSLAKIVKIDAHKWSAEQVTEMVSNLKQKQITVVITGLETVEQFEEYLACGADYFQGFFFTNPIFSSEKALSNNKLAMLKLLAEVNDPEITFEEIAQTVSTDVGLTHRLLSAINHPSTGITHQVETLKDAVNFMGLKRLKFWVNMMMMSSMEDVPTELLVAALVRAKFLEGMAEKMGLDSEKDRYFMAGLFSTLNAFLKIPMTDVVDQLPLSQEVKGALVDQTGEMGRVIWVVRALEQGNTRIDIPGREAIDLMVISSAYMAANGWAYKTIASLNG